MPKKTSNKGTCKSITPRNRLRSLPKPFLECLRPPPPLEDPTLRGTTISQPTSYAKEGWPPSWHHVANMFAVSWVPSGRLTSDDKPQAKEEEEAAKRNKSYRSCKNITPRNQLRRLSKPHLGCLHHPHLGRPNSQRNDQQPTNQSRK